MNKPSPKYAKISVSDTCCVMKSRHTNHESFAVEVQSGLSKKEKTIPSKFLYDKKGSELFDEICELEEYYLTKKELEILDSFKNEFGSHLDGQYSLVELGSGSAIKTRHIFDILSSRQDRIEYYPIDISDVIEESSQRLQEEFENLHITGIVDQYESGLEHVQKMEGKKIIAFFGSSIGNFDQHDAVEFLKTIHDSINKEDLFLAGFDLVKEKDVLESAYNDSRGTTAEFNLNILRRINRELEGRFPVEKFEHFSFYNHEKKRIEMHLRSKTDQTVEIPKARLRLEFKTGETIRTEYSHKFTIPQIKEMARLSGFKVKHIWTDMQEYFALGLFSKEEN